MAEPVKREYRSRLRADQSAATRRAIVTAAAGMFVDVGYGATTIDAVAEAAGVSRKTVFTAVGGKVELLKTALDWAVAGDDAAVALADRPGMRDLLAGDDSADVLAGWVRVLVAIDARVGGLFRALEAAADADPDGAVPLLQTYQRQRLAGARLVVGRLQQLGAMRDGLSPTKAVDVAWLGADPMLFDRLVRVRGWSVRAYEGWLTDWLAAQLLR
jgi:AcrR family transcriptional regulator